MRYGFSCERIVRHRTESKDYPKESPATATFAELLFNSKLFFFQEGHRQIGSLSHRIPRKKAGMSKTMPKKTVRIIVVILFLVAVALGMLFVPFATKIDQSIDAQVYRDGVAPEAITISIRGKRDHYVFRKNGRFSGEFKISCIAKTSEPDIQAEITWPRDYPVHLIRYSHNGQYLSKDESGVYYFLIMSKDMERFSLRLSDGAIIATSDELYNLYVDNLDYYKETGEPAGLDPSKIPEI